MARAANLRITITGDARSAQAALQSTARSANNMSVSFGGALRSMRNIGGALAIGQTIKRGFDFGTQAVFGFNSQLEQSRIAFTTMLGSAQRANTFLQQLQAFANRTPFEFPDLVSASQKLLAMGISAKNVVPYLTAIGDAAAGLGGGADTIDIMTRAIGQMTAKGRIQSEEMMQLQEAGVPALQILADQYGVTTGAMQQMITAGDVLASDAVPRLVAGLEQGTKSTAGFGGMMEKQSKTFSGAMSTIKDVATQALAGIFKPIFDQASGALQGFAATLQRVDWTAIGQRISAVFSNIANALSQVDWSAIGDRISSALSNVDWSTIGRGLGSIISSVGQLARNIGPAVGATFSTIFRVVSALVPVLVTVVAKVVEFITWLTGASAGAKVLQAVLGGVLAGFLAFKAVSGVITVITTAQKAWAAATRLVALAQTALNVALMLNPIGLLVAAIIGLVAVFAILWVRFAGFREFWIATWNIIKGAALAVARWFAGPFAGFFVKAYNALKSGAQAVYGFVKGQFNALKAAVLAVANWFRGPFVGFFVNAYNSVKNGAQTAYNTVRNAFNSLRDAVSNAIGSVLSTVTGLPGKILNAIGDLGRTLYNKGRDLIQGLIDGIKSLAGNVTDALPNPGGIFPWSAPLAPPAIPGPAAFSSIPLAGAGAAPVPQSRASSLISLPTRITATVHLRPVPTPVRVYLGDVELTRFIRRVVVDQLDAEGSRLASGAWA